MNVLESFLAGKEARRQQDAADAALAMRGYLGQHGAAIFSGDQSALAGLAGMGPEGLQTAMGIRDTMDARAARGRAEERANATAGREEWRFKREVEEYAATLDAQTAAKEAAAIENAIKAALAAPDAASFDTLMRQMGREELVGQFANREALAMQYVPMAEALKMRAGPEALSPEGKLAVDEAAGIVPPGTFDAKMAPKDPAAEQKIARLMEGGLDRNTAIALVDGRYVVSRDPMTGAVQIVDAASGKPVGLPTQDQPAPVAPQNSASGAAPYGEAYPEASTAFGVPGFAMGAANTAADVLGMGTLFPNVQTSQDSFAVLKENLVRDIANAYQRQPPAALLEAIRGLVPEAGSPFIGADGATSKLNALGRSMAEELANIDRQLSMPIRPERTQELEAQRIAVTSGMARIDEALRALAPQAIDIRPEVADRLKAYE